MKLAELRAAIERHDAATLREVVVELYRAMPDRLRAAKGVDQLVLEPAAWREGKRQRPSPAARLDPVEVLDETAEFVDNASRGYYFAPNRVVPKSARPKWRFVAKRLYRDLLAIGGDPDVGADAAAALGDLLLVLHRAEGVYLFSSTEPFEAIGVASEDFFQSAVRLLRQHQPPAAMVERALSLLEGCGDLWCPEEEIAALLAELTTPDLRELALEAADRRLAKLTAPPAPKGRQQPRRSSGEEYARRCVVVTLSTFLLRCACALHEPERGVERYLRHRRAADPRLTPADLRAELTRHGLEHLLPGEPGRPAGTASTPDPADPAPRHPRRAPGRT